MGDYLPLNCEINLADAESAFPNPALDPNFLTPNWAPPTDENACSLSIEISSDVIAAKEFTWYVIPDSVRFSSRFGEISTFQFDIVTGTKTTRQVPFIPVPWMIVDVRNISQNKRYFKGFTRHRKGRYIARNDTTYAEKQIITIFCTNLYSELERKKDIVASYNDTDIPGLTTRYILRDVIRRWAPKIGYTQIDTSLGLPVTDFDITNESPAEVLQRILDLEQTTTFRIDIDTDELLIGDKGSIAFMKNISITDANLYDYYYTDFDIEQDFDYVKNVITFNFDELLRDGTVNVADGSPIVVGYTGNENWYNKDFRDAKFKLDGDTKYYSIAENNSDPLGPTLEIILSNDFEDPDGDPTKTNVPYEIVGQRNMIVVRNSDSINSMKTLYGGNGEFTDSIGGENRNALTFEQALSVAFSYSQFFAYPLVRGQGNTNNRKFPLDYWFEAGDAMTVTLPASKGFAGEIVFQQVDAVLTPGMKKGPDGNWYPLWEWRHDWSHNLMRIENQIKKLMMQGRKVTIVNTDSLITSLGIDERVIFKNCLKPREPMRLNEEVAVSDTIRVRDFVAGPYYTAPTTNPKPAYTLGENYLSWTVP